ncbi:MAG: hypothetical protein EBS19_06970 [Spirochaetia bacterium]|nr:hypothetical protein [Spirochaetia bacterium]
MIEPFRKRFNEYKLSVSGLSSLPEESFMHWLKTYVNKNSQFNPLNFLPGKVYSFQYNDKLEQGKKFINKRPVIFFTGYDNYEKKNLFQGLDIVLISPIFRLAFFERVQSVFQDQIEKNIKSLEKGEGRDQIPLKTDYQIMDTVLKGIPYKHAYRAWDLKKVRDVVEIPFEDWTRIIYLDTRSIEGTQLSEIYSKNSQV